MSSPVDFDGDGLVDIFVANDSTPNYLYHNNGNAKRLARSDSNRRGGQRKRRRAGMHGRHGWVTMITMEGWIYSSQTSTMNIMCFTATLLKILSRTFPMMPEWPR